ncbi:hypothetical protein ElyMa_000238000 [Elysia marginata]|uniref:Uncharacterized protein n=1 Tax=Elysia marginata TaxID=1093978 RepID=A0AAV4F1N5_9GAST|nr:hypothetical protein ElyMa_000238000 [Elysia marginata]
MYMSHSQPEYAHPPLETKRRVCRDEREREWSWPNYAATEKVPSSRSTSMILVHHRATPVCSVARARTISTTPFMTVLRSTFSEPHHGRPHGVPLGEPSGND